MNKITVCFCADILCNSRPGWVYLVKAEGTSRYKIGRSTQLITRLEILKGQSPYPLKVINTFYTINAVRDESYLHQRFCHLRIHGEWFEDDKNQIAYWFETNLVSLTNYEIYEKFLERVKELKIDFHCQQDYQVNNSILKILQNNPQQFFQAVDYLEDALKEARLFGQHKTNFDESDFLVEFISGIAAAMGVQR